MFDLKQVCYYYHYYNKFIIIHEPDFVKNPGKSDIFEN